MAAAVIVHDRDHLAAVYRASKKAGQPIAAITARNAAAYAGVLYLKKMCDSTAAEHGPAQVQVAIDCGDDAANVQAALAEGWRRLIFTGRAEVADKLRAIAAQYDAELVDPPTALVDLMESDDPEQTCAALFSAGRP